MRKGGSSGWRLTAGFNRPGGNLTGIALLDAEMAAKRLELHELVSHALVLAVLVNPSSPTSRPKMRSPNSVAHSLGRQILSLNAGNEREIDTAFTIMVASPCTSRATDAFFISRRDQIAGLAAREVIPAMYPRREFLSAGGLIRHGNDLLDVLRQVGAYSGAVLKGAKPSDLSVLQPTKFELVINMKATNALGLEIPRQAACARHGVMNKLRFCCTAYVPPLANCVAKAILYGDQKFCGARLSCKKRRASSLCAKRTGGFGIVLEGIRIGD